MGGGASTANLTPEEMNDILRNTSFSRKQVERIWRRFQSLDQEGDGQIPTQVFFHLPEFSGNPLAHRLLECLTIPRGLREREQRQDHIGFVSFVSAMNVFNVDTPDETKLQYLFKMFDRDGDGFLNREDLRLSYLDIIGKSMSQQEVENMAKTVIRQCDKDGDGKLSIMEFSAMIDKDELYSRMTINF